MSKNIQFTATTCRSCEEESVEDKEGVPVLGAIKWSVTCDTCALRCDCCGARHQQCAPWFLEPRGASGQSVTMRLYVPGPLWQQARTSTLAKCAWEKNVCAAGVLFTPPVDCQEIKFLASEIKITHLERSKKKKVHCSLQDGDFHESQFHVDHKSLLGCHRDDEDEDECVVEEG